MIAPDGYALLINARDSEEIEVLVGLLEGEGIDTWVPGQSLIDDYAAPQKLMNLMSIEVWVPEGDLEKARAVVAEAHEAGKSLEADEDAETEP